jgi:hypothetical protein
MDNPKRLPRHPLKMLRFICGDRVLDVPVDAWHATARSSREVEVVFSALFSKMTSHHDTLIVEIAPTKGQPPIPDFYGGEGFDLIQRFLELQPSIVLSYARMALSTEGAR